MVQEVVRHNANITNIMDKSLSYLFGMFYLFCDVAKKNVFRSFRFFRVSSSDQDFQSDLIMFFYLNYHNVIIRRNIWRILNNNNIKNLTIIVIVILHNGMTLFNIQFTFGSLYFEPVLLFCFFWFYYFGSFIRNYITNTINQVCTFYFVLPIMKYNLFFCST